jgi:SlyX protein
MDQPDLTSRLEKVETKLAYLEDFLDRLQEVVVSQGSVLDRLGTEHSAVKAQLLRLSEDLEELPNRRPPHY